MSQFAAYSSFDAGQSSLASGLLSFYRRWFASETIYNANALNEVGLHLL